jgi:electron transfer flavoprotein alpha subunit
MSILIILEAGHRVSEEALAAGQSLGAASAAIVGDATAPATAAAATRQLAKVYSIQHELLAAYTADGFTAAYEQLIRAVKPTLVILPHTYQVRDWAPKLATRFGRALVSDVVKLRREGDAVVATRQLFQGKLNADYRLMVASNSPADAAPEFVSLQAGAYRADAALPGTAPVEIFTPELSAGQIRVKPEAPFREAARAVDLTAAERIVSVGRGIGEQDKIGLIEELARAMKAELAASRPICDNGWLPMERQVGSSGQTVSPKLYLAVGISGAIQHLVGMKGASTIAAINKDAGAPIFEVADYGIVGDLFEVVPALIEALKAS